MARNRVATTTDVAPSDLRIVESAYHLRDRESIFVFLNEHPYLVPIVVEAAAKVPWLFSDPDLELVLEVVDDPEPEGHRQLVLWIRTSLPSEKALPQLERVDKQWWLQRMPQTFESMVLSIDHR